VADVLKGSPPRTRLLVALGFVFVVATICQGLGLALGNLAHGRLSPRMPPALRRTDRIGGAVAGGLGILVVVWLLIPALASSPGWPTDF